MIRTFTILHTNDIHSNLVGVGPASEYTPATPNDDRTIGGIERIATLVAERKRAREADGPVLVLDIGDFSVGTPFGGAFQQTGAELQCLSLAGYDATTFGNHDFDFGPAALANAVASAHELEQKNDFDQATKVLAEFTARHGADAKVAEMETRIRGGKPFEVLVGLASRGLFHDAAQAPQIGDL